MNAEDYLYEQCYDWVTLVINPPGTLPEDVIPIIKAYQDAPAPKGTYIAIEMPSVRRAGRANVLMDSEDLTGTASYVSDFVGRVSFWQVGGSGELLRKIEQATDTRIIKEFFVERKIALFNYADIYYLPRVEEKSRVQESRVELSIGFAVAHTEEIGWVETVELINQIGDNV